ncbi:MAG: diacylglycerol kinase family lipid kinase [Ignavibacteriales bacterium]|nr:diacylglycerol kinase family lipid kinase [Ignavibacteriales bacterium]
MKIFYLNNPAAGHKNGVKYYPLIEQLLKKKNILHDSVQTEYAGHGTEIIKNIDFEKYDGIIASGGDGTIFEALNGYFANSSKKRIPFGAIPIGRGNAFARDLDLIPERWEESIDAILSGRTKKIDVGAFTTEGIKYYFINILGFGFVTDIAGTAQKLKMFGDLSYVLGVFYQTAALKAYNLKIEADGKMIERKNVFVEISNTRYTGKDFLMAPLAKLDDGLLDVTLLNKLSRAKVMQCLPKIFKGTHVYMKEVETFRARHLKIETDTPKLLTPDGQLMGSTPIEVECLPGAIEVFVK